MTKLVYLAGPIDRAGGSAGLMAMKLDASFCLQTLGFSVFDPSSAFRVIPGAEVDNRIFRINQGALNRCDGMLALLPDGVPTIGTPMEMGRAIDMYGIPVAVVGGEGSWHLAGYDTNRDVQLFSNVKGACQWLSKAMADSEQRTQRLLDVVQVAGDGELPTRSYSGDAGFDLYVRPPTPGDGAGVWVEPGGYGPSTWKIRPGQFVDIPCGVAVELPERMWARIVGRSSTLRKRGLMVAEGTIDQGYRGELFSGVWNLSSMDAYVKAGERIAQLIPMHLTAERVRMVRVEKLSDSDRGEAGFGSSGV